jgi:exopolysaccharide biosynthesis WecB/TagA/CpsF family protein
MSCATRQVRGADLLAAFCELASRKGYTSYFYGDTEEILALASDRLRRQCPGLKIVGAHSPPFREPTAEEDARAVEAINRAHPDVLWVALGLPKQEKWIAAHRERVKAPIIVAVGAAIKFHSGKVKPAPRWASQSGMEWFWRFLHEPRRTWRRAFVYGPEFAVLSLLDVSYQSDIKDSVPPIHGWRRHGRSCRRPWRCGFGNALRMTSNWYQGSRSSSEKDDLRAQANAIIL